MKKKDAFSRFSKVLKQFFGIYNIKEAFYALFDDSLN
jgi:hypothetical protein